MLKEFFAPKNFLNYLVFAIPVAVVLELQHANPVAIFIASALAIIPLSALVTFPSDGQAGGKSQLGVFVVQENKAMKRVVKTGDIFNSSILVTEGLRAGEQVVTAGASFLYDGAPVEVAAEIATK